MLAIAFLPSLTELSGGWMRWVASVLRKNDSLSAKACFPPLNSKGYHFPSGVQRMGLVRKHITCFLGVLLHCHVALGESDSVKSTNRPSGKKGSPFHSKGQQIHSPRLSQHTSPDKQASGHVTYSCVSYDQVEWGHAWARGERESSLLPLEPGGWVFPFQRGENKVHQWHPHSGNSTRKRAWYIRRQRKTHFSWVQSLMVLQLIIHWFTHSLRNPLLRVYHMPSTVLNVPQLLSHSIFINGIC